MNVGRQAAALHLPPCCPAQMAPFLLTASWEATPPVQISAVQSLLSVAGTSVSLFWSVRRVPLPSQMFFLQSFGTIVPTSVPFGTLVTTHAWAGHDRDRHSVSAPQLA